MHNGIETDINSSFQQELYESSPSSYPSSIQPLPPQDRTNVNHLHQPLQFKPVKQNQPQSPPRLSKKSVTEQHLWDLANTYYNHARKQQPNIKSKKNLLEYYTLVQLAIISLQKLIALGPTATLRLRLKANLKIAQILINENGTTDSMFESEDQQPGTYLDQVILLTNQNQDYLRFNVQANVILIQQLLKKELFKQALKMIDSLIQYQSLPIFKYLRFQTLSNLDPILAINYIQSFIASTDFQHIDSYDTRLFFLLNESRICLEIGVQSIVQLDDLQPSSVLHLTVLQQFISIMYELSHMAALANPKHSESLSSKLKRLGLLLSENKISLSSSLFSIKFPLYSNHQEIEVLVPWFNYSTLNILFYLFFGISTLHMSFEKRDSLKTFNKCDQMIENELNSFTNANSQIKSIQEQIVVLMELQKLTAFYTLIENSMTEEIKPDVFNRLIHEISLDETVNTLYLKAIYAQQSGHLQEAKTLYYKVIQQLQPKQESVYNDLYIISHMNVLAIIESALSYHLRQGDSTKYSSLNQERTTILSELQKIQSSKKTTYETKYLLASTLKFLGILYNYNNASIIEQQSQITEIIESNFDKIKRFTLFASSLLYIKSSTLNQNSDQKQKSSQLAFNLAKMGYMPLIRYVTGILNGNNAKVARNLQQFEVQRQKLEKIEKNRYYQVQEYP